MKKTPFILLLALVAMLGLGTTGNGQTDFEHRVHGQDVELKAGAQPGAWRVYWYRGVYGGGESGSKPESQIISDNCYRLSSPLTARSAINELGSKVRFYRSTYCSGAYDHYTMNYDSSVNDFGFHAQSFRRVW